MPHHFAVRIWDLVFLEGYEAVIIATVAQMVMLQNKIKMEPSFNEIFEYVHFLQTPSLTADIQVAATEERTRMGHGGLHEMLRTGSQGVEKILQEGQEEEESYLDPSQTIKAIVPLTTRLSRKPVSKKDRTGDYPDSTGWNKWR